MPLESPVVLIVVELGVASNNEAAATAMLVLMQQRLTIEMSTHSPHAMLTSSVLRGWEVTFHLHTVQLM